MEFLLIMGIGTVLAVWAVIATRPKGQPTVRPLPFSPDDFSPRATPEWKKDISLSHPYGEMEYLEAIERHDNDPQHQPFPFPPTVRRQNSDDACE